MLYHIDITFRNGNVACFGIESDQSDTYITRCAPIAKGTASRRKYKLRAVLDEYRRRGAHIQAMRDNGWVELFFYNPNKVV